MLYIKYRTVEAWNYMSYEISTFHGMFYNHEKQFAYIATCDELINIGFFMSHEEYMKFEEDIFNAIYDSKPILDVTDRVAFLVLDDMDDTDYKNALFNTLHNAKFEEGNNENS